MADVTDQKLVLHGHRSLRIRHHLGMIARCMDRLLVAS